VSVHEQVFAARQRLRDAGISHIECDLEARLLAQHVLGWSTERFLTDAHTPEPAGFMPSYDALVSRRVTREPFAYIVGGREFWGLDFEVNPAVLIPRPSTELIVQAMIELFRERSAPLEVADVCTGCGCVAIALAHERPAATIIGTDISAEALEVAERNAVRHGVSGRVTFRQGDLHQRIDWPLDAVLANPPYVVDRAAPALQPEVRDHEPAVALFGGAEGRDLLTRLVDEAPSRLRPGGYLVFEFGLGQDVEIEEMLERAPDLQLIDIRRDLQGIARTAVAQRS
jgi:release factor glutamine methyltransferase